jgi:nicotinate-nucleotide adenylyltransferase
VALGILGGTFDPVHNAHLAMARAALAALPLEDVIFLPTGSPRYRNAPIADAMHRVAMLKLALTGEKKMRVDERELSADASPYTVDTLKSFKADSLERDIYFLMGADQLAKLGSWHRPDEVRRLAKLAVFARPGYQAAEKDVQVVPMLPMAVSASDIRARCARGESIAGLVPPPVENYIQRHGLYK